MLYADYRYGWGERTVGFTLAGVGVCSMIVQGGLVGPIVKRFGERRALLVGLVCGVVGLLPRSGWRRPVPGSRRHAAAGAVGHRRRRRRRR